MKFFTSAFAVAAFLLSVVSAGPNPISAPAGGDVVTAGAPYTIKWQATTSGTITLMLRKGPSTNLKTLAVLAKDIANAGSFVWSVSATLAAGDDYAIEIDAADGTPNYTGLFSIKSSVKSASSAEVSTTADVTSTTPSTTIVAETTGFTVTDVSTTTSAEKTKTTVAANSTIETSTFITSTTMRSNHTTTTVPSHGNSTITSFTKTLTSTTTSRTVSTTAKATMTTGAATRISGAGALMAVAAAAAAFVL